MRARNGFILGVVLVLVGLVAYALYPYVERAPTLCLFRMVTGQPCPSCGMTRATCALVHGEWAKAMRYHPLVVPFWAAIVAMGWTYFVLPDSAGAERWRRGSLWAFLLVVGCGLLIRVGEWVR